MPSSSKAANQPKSKPQSRGVHPGQKAAAAAHYNIDPMLLHQLIEDTVEPPALPRSHHGGLDPIKRGPSPQIAIVNQSPEDSGVRANRLQGLSGEERAQSHPATPGDDPLSLEENELVPSQHDSAAGESAEASEHQQHHLAISGPKAEVRKASITKNDQIVIKAHKVFLAEDQEQSIADIDGAEVAIKGAKELENEREESKRKEDEKTKVVNYETFESSSEEEFSVGAFESAANSFAGKEKEEDATGAVEQKRVER